MSSPEDVRFTIGGVRIGHSGAFWSLDKAGWKAVLKSTLEEFKADKVTNLAAVVTLRILLAIVPSLIAAVAIAAQVIDPSDITDLVNSADGLIPGSAEEFVDDSLTTALESLKEDSTVALLISIGAGLFAASGAAAALVVALNAAYDQSEGRGFVGQRLAAFGVLGGLVLALLGLFVAIILGPTLLEALLPERIYDSPLRFLITLGRYLAAMLILMLFFSFTFWFGPNRDRPPLRFLTPGSVAGVVLWLVLSFLFGLYVSISGSYNATYGAFAGVIVMLVWLQYSFTVLLLAAELDHELEVHLARRDGDPGRPDGAIGARASETGAAATDIDLDAVTDEMPRHPGLIGAAAGPATAVPQGSEPVRRVPPPTLVGAAAHTSGATVAKLLLHRLGRKPSGPWTS